MGDRPYLYNQYPAKYDTFQVIDYTNNNNTRIKSVISFYLSTTAFIYHSLTSPVIWLPQGQFRPSGEKLLSNTTVKFSRIREHSSQISCSKETVY